jgi:hypothetical protein
MTCTQHVTRQMCLVLIYLIYRREYYLPWSDIRTRDPSVTGVQMWLLNVVEESVIFGLLSFLKGKSSFSGRRVFYVYPDVPQNQPAYLYSICNEQHGTEDTHSLISISYIQ